LIPKPKNELASDVKSIFSSKKNVRTIGRKIEKCSINATKNRRFGISRTRVFCIRV
jgi:hypothetical protein